MPEKLLGENVQFRIEVEDRPKSILLVFDKKCDWAIVPFQNAYELADLMLQVARDVKAEFARGDIFTIEREQAQVQLNFHKGLVALLVEHTDRLRFTTIEAFTLVAKALKKVAQDSQLSLRGVHLQYDRQGMIKKLFNTKLDTVQIVR